MSCEEVNNLVAGGEKLNGSAEAHVKECQACQAILEPLADSGEMPDSDRLNRTKDSITGNWKPVRPLPSDRALTSILLLVFLLFATVATVPIGRYAVHVLTGLQMVLYYGAILISAVFLAVALVQSMVPGSKRRVNLRLTMTLVAISLAVLVAALFRNFNSAHFSRGTGCFQLGSVCAFASGLLVALVIRKGFFLYPVATAATAGFFSGMAGVAVLALYCPVQAVPHILVWHLGVLVVGTFAGALSGKFLRIGKNDFTSQRNF
jgi:hypothetical protein